MRRIAISILAITFLSSPAFAQKKTESPADAALNFYRALKEKRYVEGFHHSIYRAAAEGLSTDELKDLEGDFAQSFSSIPDKIEPRGEQINGDTAVVFLKFDGIDEPQQVALIRVDGEWLVGDKDSFEVVKAQGRAFFFNARIQANESEAFDMLQRMIGAELLYSQKFQSRYASLQELIKLGGAPEELESGTSNGYRFTLTVSRDGKSFSATATPDLYGKTGRLSFYADIAGVRAEDLKGRAATAASPVYQPN